MMKKFLALLLALMMLAALMTACGAAPAGDAPSGDASAPAEAASTAEGDADAAPAGNDEPFVIGMRFPVTIDQMQQQTIDNCTMLVEAAGGTLLIDNAPLTPEGNIQTYERLIAGGADAIAVLPAADSVLPRINEMCEAAGIPWSIYFRSILDEGVKSEILASPYFLGNTYEDEYLAGYELTKKMGEAGLKNIVIFAGALGDTTSEQREAGMQQACEEYGITVINEFRNVPQASDATLAMESVLNTHPEVDGIFCVTGTLTPGILPALTSMLDEYDRQDVKLAIIDFPEGLQEAFAAGYMISAGGGHNITDPMFSVSLLINYLKGTPLSDEAQSIRINQMFLNSEEDVINYFKYCESGMATYTEDEVKEMMWQFTNPDVTMESFMTVAESYSIEDVVERHKDLVE